MTKFFCEFLVIFQIIKIVQSGVFLCAKNEAFQQCATSCEMTCQKPHERQCNYFSCTPGCVCKPGFVRDESSRRCVSENACPRECGINETWSRPTRCPETCQNRAPKYCSLPCEFKCICKVGFLWDEVQNKCVPKCECSKVCGKNQEWCEYALRDLPTCQSLTKPQPKCHKCGSSIIEPQGGCVCKKGYIWEEIFGRCITIEDCLSGAGIAPEKNVTLTLDESSTEEILTTHKSTTRASPPLIINTSKPKKLEESLKSFATLWEEVKESVKSSSGKASSPNAPPVQPQFGYTDKREI